ncbi:hypothetical protein FRC09_020154 [Ceratobasidium sp. 395]|nr:hypothetical protein FRC09_020154 [Ceratobasidium sp. 395]
MVEGGLAGGLSSLMIFKELMARVRAAGGSSQIRKVYKMMAGTGTGALIACMLALLGLDVDRAIEAYSKLMEAVFSEKKSVSMSGSGTFKAGKLEEELRKMVQEATGDENTLMMKTQHDEEECKVMVFAMSERNMNASTPRIFRSYQGPNNQMPNCPIWQVLRATMAHPELFKSFLVGEASTVAESLVGGDVSCSNPTVHVLAEFSALYPELRVASIVCIGAGHARTIQIPKPNPLHRFMPTNVLMAMKDIATDSERVAQEVAARFQTTSDVYFRFSVDQGMQDARMSQWQEKSEVAAHTRSYMQKPEVSGQIDKAAQSVVASNGVLVGADIGGTVRQSVVQLTTGVKRCPAPSSAFTGCERQISQVVNCLLGRNNERRVCVVHGLGGSGKTQIALKSAERTRDNWSDIVYVDATTRETAIATLKGFAQARKIGETHEDALRWLELSSQPWLLVIDNADDPDLGLRSFIPGGSYGSVLVTTRLRKLALLGRGPGANCKIGAMDSEDAIELLLARARMQDEVLSNEEMDAAARLVQDLGYLALAIVHASAYIFCSNTSIAKYRKHCLDNAQIYLEKYSELVGDVEEYEKTVYTTWAMSYEKLTPQTRCTLGLMAHLHHGGITEEIFQRAASHINCALQLPPNDEERATRNYVRDCLMPFLDADGHWDSNAFSKVTDELVLYSLIDYDRVNEVFTLHVLVQDWTCTTIPHPKTIALAHTSHLLALSICYSSHDMEFLTYRRRLLLHVSKLLDKLDRSNTNDAELLSWVCYDNDRWKEAELLQAQAVDAYKRVLGELNPDTLSTMNTLASTYTFQGRLDEAEALQVQALDALRQTLGERHRRTLTAMSTLAFTYRKQGRWAKAEALQVEVVVTSKETLGELHFYTLRCMGNLAQTYSAQSLWSEAEALFTQVLDAMKQRLGELHPDTLTTLVGLARTYSNQGRWDEAEALQVKVVDAQKQTLGELHPDTLIAMIDLARTYSNQDRWADAEALQLKVMDAGKQTLGELHLNTLDSMTHLAATYQSQGRWDEAETLQVQVLDAQKRTIGELHADTLVTMVNLACIYSKQGQWDKAEALKVKAMDAMKQTLGDLHPDALTSIGNLASTYRDQGRWDEAEVLEVQVVDARKKTLGEKHRITLNDMAHLVSTYQGQGRWDEAETLQVQVLDVQKQTLGELHSHTLRGMYNLSWIYLHQGRLDAAETLQVQAVAAFKRVFGEERRETLVAMELLARIYDMQQPQRIREFEQLEVEINRLKDKSSTRAAES